MHRARRPRFGLARTTTRGARSPSGPILFSLVRATILPQVRPAAAAGSPAHALRASTAPTPAPHARAPYCLRLEGGREGRSGAPAQSYARIHPSPYSHPTQLRATILPQVQAVGTPSQAIPRRSRAFSVFLSHPPSLKHRHTHIQRLQRSVLAP